MSRGQARIGSIICALSFYPENHIDELRERSLRLLEIRGVAIDRRDVMDRALEKYRKIMHGPLMDPVLDTDPMREIEQIVQAVDTDILVAN